MKKKQIKQIVNDSFNNETPDFLTNIKDRCRNTIQIEPTYNKEKKK